MFNSKLMMTSKAAPGMPEDVKAVYCYHGSDIGFSTWEEKNLVVEWTNPESSDPEVLKYDVESTWYFGSKSISPNGIASPIGNNRMRVFPYLSDPPSESEEVLGVRVRGVSRTRIGPFSSSAEVVDGTNLSPTGLNWSVDGSNLTISWNPPAFQSFYANHLGWTLAEYRLSILFSGFSVTVESSASSHVFNLAGQDLATLAGKNILLSARYESSFATNPISGRISIRDRSPINRTLG